MGERADRWINLSFYRYDGDSSGYCFQQWKRWIEEELSHQVQASPTTAFLQECCAICNQSKVLKQTEMIPHPVFADRLVCRDCIRLYERGFTLSKGCYEECMFCFCPGRMIPCDGGSDPDKCPFAICVGCLYYQAPRAGAEIVQRTKDERQWLCWVCERAQAQAQTPAAAVAASASAAAAAAAPNRLRLRTDWRAENCRSVRAVRAASASVRGSCGSEGWMASEDEDSDVSDQDHEEEDDQDHEEEDDRYKNELGEAPRPRTPTSRHAIRRRGSTTRRLPRHARRGGGATPWRRLRASNAVARQRPRVLFEISLQCGDHQHDLAENIGLSSDMCDARLVSAAPRKRYFFSQNLPQVTLKPAQTTPLTIAAFLREHCGEEALKNWAPADTRTRFATVTTKRHQDRINKFTTMLMEGKTFGDFSPEDVKKMRSANLVWDHDTGLLCALPLELTEALMGFPPRYTGVGKSDDVRAKMCG